MGDFSSGDLSAESLSILCSININSPFFQSNSNIHDHATCEKWTKDDWMLEMAMFP